MTPFLFVSLASLNLVIFSIGIKCGRWLEREEAGEAH